MEQQQQHLQLQQQLQQQQQQQLQQQQQQQLQQQQQQQQYFVPISSERVAGPNNGIVVRHNKTAMKATAVLGVATSSTNPSTSNTASTTPSLKASLAFIIVLLFSALSMITWTARSGPINLGKIVAPPQPGTRPRKTSGRPVKAVEAKVR